MTKRIIFFDIEGFGVNYRYSIPPERYMRLFQWSESRDGEVNVTTDRQEALDVIRSADLVIAWNQIHYDLPALFGTDSLEPLQMAYDRKVLDGMIWAPLLMRVPNQFQDRAGRTYYPHSKTSGGPKVIRKFFGLDQMAFNLDVPGKIMPLSDLAAKYAPEIPVELQERIDRHETIKRFNREMEIVRYAPDGRYDPYGAIPLDDPEFLAYAKQDVVTLQQVMVKLLEMSDNRIDEYTWTEMFNVSIDARIASNGWRVDIEEAKRAVVVAEERRTALMDRLQTEYDFPTEGKQPWRTTAGKQAIMTALTEAGVNPEDDPDWPRTKTGVSLGGQVLVDRTEGTDAHDLAVSLAELMGQRPLAQKLLDVVFPDGRVHPDISNLQLTGRRSYNEPSLSTWTARGPGSEEKRYLISDDGCSLLEVDLSAADARAVAAYSGDENYLERFEPGIDAHELTGRLVFGDAVYDENPKHYRHIAKTCIAEGELVLTDHGIVPIEKVTECMLLWDGIEWVRHEGVTYNGIRETITYQGLRATPDHTVFTPHGEIPFGLAAERNYPLTQTGDNGATIRAGDNYLGRDSSEDRGTQLLRGRRMPELSTPALGSIQQPGSGDDNGVPILPAPREVPVSLLATHAPHGRQTAMHEPEEAVLLPLRRAGDHVRLCQCERSRNVPAGPVPRHDSRSGYRQDRLERTIRTGESPHGLPRGEPGEQAQYRTESLGPGVLAVFPSGRNPKVEVGNDPGRDYRGCETDCAGEGFALQPRQRETRVYDIRNAGPRHRFTVSNVLVHNCNHAYAYRAGIRKLTTASGQPEEVARKFVDVMKQRYPKVIRWQNECEDRAKTGRMVNGFGRPLWTDPDRAYNQGPAAIGQSTTTEILYAGFRRIFEHDPQWMYWLRATVHDAALWNVPNDSLDYAYDRIPELMTIQWEPPYGTGQRVTFECDRGPKGATNWYLAGH